MPFLEGVSLEQLAAGGAFVAFVVTLVLWRVVKLALKIVVFVVVAVVLAGGVAMYLEHGRVGAGMPLPDAGSLR